MTKKIPTDQSDLTPEQVVYFVEHGTERPNTSALLNEKRAGIYCCARCDQPLFKSEYKYDSGTGWPSFFNAIEDNIDFTDDNKLGYVRTEYHCKQCRGHQGHLFNDGPQPSGLRYCNNGIALRFIEE